MASSKHRSQSSKLMVMRNYHQAADLKMSGILFFALHLCCRVLKLIARHFFGRRYRSTFPKKFCNPPLTPPLRRRASARTPSGVSFASGLPGGWWIAGTVPVDLTQFFWHSFVMLQKLAYLYGWPELFSEDSELELDDETLLILTVFVGAMLGAESAAKVLSDIAERAATQVLKRLPRETLTKLGLNRLAREVAKSIGIKLTEDSFARYLSRIVPILGGIISGTVTWISFSLMTSRLAAHLESLPLAANVIKRRRNDRRYVRRNKNGEVKREVNVGLSLAAEPRREGKTKVKPPMGIAEM